MGDEKIPTRVKHFEEESKVLQEMPLWKFRAEARENRDKSGGGGNVTEQSSQGGSGGGTSVAAILLENDSELLLEDGTTTIDIE